MKILLSVLLLPLSIAYFSMTPSQTHLSGFRLDEKPIAIDQELDDIQAFSHNEWNLLLKKHVTAGGKVNYKGFKTDQSKLDAYLKRLTHNPPQSSWDKKEKLAF